MNSQKQDILNYLLSGKSLTPIYALNFFGCFRLAARISEIRADGYDVKTRTVKDGKKSYAEYWYDFNGDISTRRTD